MYTSMDGCSYWYSSHPSIHRPTTPKTHPTHHSNQSTHTHVRTLLLRLRRLRAPSPRLALLALGHARNGQFTAAAAGSGRHIVACCCCSASLCIYAACAWCVLVQIQPWCHDLGGSRSLFRLDRSIDREGVCPSCWRAGAVHSDPHNKTTADRSAVGNAHPSNPSIDRRAIKSAGQHPIQAPIEGRSTRPRNLIDRSADR